ncbi:MAG TPA: glycosyltransferase, partial [bacterium]|nr:glycosyltransferase [bacterium]
MSFKARPVYFLIRDIDGRGGTEKFARSLALSLARQGQPIKIITTRHSLKRESRYLNEKGTVRVVRFFVPSWRVLGTFWYFLVLLVYLLRKKNEYELLQVFFLEYTALAAVLAGTLLKKKVLCRLACGGLYSDLLSLLKKPGGRFWLAVVKKKSFFVVMSHSMVQELINYGFLRERVYLIPNGVETDIFQPGRHPGSPEKKIIFVGRLTQQKGLEYLLRAMALMEEKNVSLILVGEGEKKEELRHLVLQLHLGDRVFFAGYQSQSLSYLQEADVFVLPSLA